MADIILQLSVDRIHSSFWSEVVAAPDATLKDFPPNYFLNGKNKRSVVQKMRR